DQGGTRISGVETGDGRRFTAHAVIITAGTFLRGRIHLGTDTQIPAGRAGDAPSIEMAQVIANAGLTVSRFKTGTPPRVDGRSVNWSEVERQDGDRDDFRFSCHERVERPRQVPCWITWAGEEVKEIIQRHLKESALYGGAISGRGPRYCPSVEDKIVKFPAANRHQIFLEPEGLDTTELYVNGLSTSLPVPVQLEFLHAVPGLEHARMTRPGYAIEYDYSPPSAGSLRRSRRFSSPGRHRSHPPRPRRRSRQVGRRWRRASGSPWSPSVRACHSRRCSAAQMSARRRLPRPSCRRRSRSSTTA